MSKGTTRQYYRRIHRRRLNRSIDPSPKVRHGYGNSFHFAEDRSSE